MKCEFYFAFLAFIAIFALLASCGEGEPIDLADGGVELASFNNARSNLTGDGGLIKKCETEGDERCPSYGFNNPSSSSEGGPGSPSPSSNSVSSGPGVLSCKLFPAEVFTNTSITPTVLCDGALVGDVNFNSSKPHTVSPSKSSITLTEQGTYTFTATAYCGTSFKTVNCTPNVLVSTRPENVYNVPNFTCSWAPNPVTAGDPSTVSITIDNPTPTLTAECTAKKVFIIANPGQAILDTAFITVGVNTTSGTVPRKFSGTWPWPVPSSSSTNVIFTGLLTCTSSDGTRTGTESAECNPLTLTKPPEPIISGTATVTFTNISYSSSSGLYYYSEVTPGFSHNITAINNNTDAKCDKIRYEIKGPGNYSSMSQDYDISGQDPATINFGTPARTFTANSALPSVNSSGNVTARVIATCRGIEYSLATAKATLVPNPSLSGECKWNVANNTYLGGTSPVLGTPVPTVQNNYGRCATTPVLSQNGTDAYGKLPDVAQGTTQQVTLRAYAACPSGTPYGAGLTCPTITVKNAADACDYVPDTHCGGVAKGSIITAAQNWTGSGGGSGTGGNDSKGKCFYATGITKIAAGDVKINGKALPTNNGNCADDGQWSLPSCSSELSSVSKVDDGYYIHVGSNGWVENGFITQNTHNGLHPNCR